MTTPAAIWPRGEDLPTTRRSEQAETATSARYEPRRPAEDVLYQIVRAHFETYHTQAASLRDGEGLPRFVEGEFWNFLRCGSRAGGFARFRCAACGGRAARGGAAGRERASRRGPPWSGWSVRVGLGDAGCESPARARSALGRLDAAHLRVRRSGLSAVRRAPTPDRADRSSPGHPTHPSSSRAAHRDPFTHARPCPATLKRRPRGVRYRLLTTTSQRSIARDETMANEVAAKRPAGAAGRRVLGDADHDVTEPPSRRCARSAPQRTAKLRSRPHTVTIWL